MLDIKRIRNNPDMVKQAMLNRSKTFDVSLIDKAVELDERRRQILVEVEALKSKRNTDSQQIPKLKKEGKPVDALMAEMKELSDRIKNMMMSFQRLKKI